MHDFSNKLGVKHQKVLSVLNSKHLVVTMPIDLSGNKKLET